MREKSKHISFRIIESNLKEIDKIAYTNNYDRSRVLNEALKTRLPNLQKKLELNETLSDYTELLKNGFHSIQQSFSNLNRLLQLMSVIQEHPNHAKWSNAIQLNIQLMTELKKECLHLNNTILKVLENINE
ncbi:hypothetical protein [Wielerella bovis]|uniref:hypothetical protein n=1 Tax=Wielerella bovis TaxID=2917790 RepID=UPI002018CDA7|nr:hypothetical protein [Wielerella bovis]ULJ59500.1 hypothetical protein MIS44_07265 [Wielerella bovis]ULJ61618.1 hypothetical protein MIS46_06290 [Wielerella bovis]ULJ63745.1 hypothetical protein MIS33_06080 [Wielerella bovis]ULJ66087.1 hypothetical protein MIS31_07355 [Wielerella bovis]